jgi:hypothetical protein
MSEHASLVERMLKLAETHACAIELRQKAEELRAAANGFFGQNQTVDVRAFMGAWARARRLWCNLTGESIL